MGRLQDLTAAGGDPDPTLSLNPTAFDFKPPRVNQWNVGIQHKLWKEVILDVAYVGSKSTDLLRQVQINAVPFGATFLPQNQDPTRVPSAVLGSSALPNDFLRPYRGYGDIRMWDYSGYGNYKALQTSVTRRFDRGFMFSGFWVWSKAHGINSTDFAAGVPNLTEEQTKHLDYSLLDYDRTHNFTLNAIYQTTVVHRQQGARPGGERLADLGRLPMDERPAVRGQLLDSRHRRANLTGTDGNPNARIVVTCDPGIGYSGDPYQQFEPGVLRAAAAGQQGQRIVAVLRAQPADQQPRPVALQELRHREDA